MGLRPGGSTLHSVLANLYNGLYATMQPDGLFQSRSCSRRSRRGPGPVSSSAPNATGRSTTTRRTRRPPGAAPSAERGCVPGDTASATARPRRGSGAWTLLPVVSLGTAVLQGWELLPKVVEVVEVQGGERVSVAVGALGEHSTPRVDDDGPSVGPSSVGLPPPLGRSDDIDLILHGPRPQQKLPVVLARLEREGGRDSEYLGAAQRQQSVELGEA